MIRNKCLVEKEKRFLYAHDTGWFLEETWEYLKGKELSLVSLDCTHGKNRDTSLPLRPSLILK